MTRSLNYSNTDDTIARRVIDDALRDRDSLIWYQLTDSTYAAQTLRILVVIEKLTQAAFAARGKDYAELKFQFNQGRLSRRQLLEAKRDYEEWKARTNHFRAVVNEKMHLARKGARAANRAEWENRQLSEADELRKLISELAMAAARHRRDTTDPTTAARLLWARMDVLCFPSSGGGHRPTLTEYTDRKLARETNSLIEQQ